MSLMWSLSPHHPSITIPARHGPAAPGPPPVVAGGNLPFEALVDLLDADPAGDAIAPVGQPLDRRRGRLPLVPDLPHDLLEDVLHGDDAHPPPVLVPHP